MMRTLLIMAKAAAGIAVFLVLLGFAVKNTEGVVVHYFLGLEWQAPLVFVLLVFFAAGVVLGLTASLAILVRQRREILGLKRELRGLTRSPVAPMLAESA
ncbi:MAG: LapA family protein [Proteobacteria bacterium]|nr:LapA family protein [Pseudomonadota bacterium]